MYKDERGYVDTQDNQKDFSEKYVDDSAGPYIAPVSYTHLRAHET